MTAASPPSIASSAPPLLEVRRLRIEFPTRRGTLVAIDDISFSIAPGEVLGVVGESGAGKSLTGAAIIGLLEPPGRIAGGEVRLAGRRIDTLPYEDMRKIRGREIGAIFQDPLTSLNPLYTVGDQLVETITTHLNMSSSSARVRAIELLASTGIPAPERRIDAYPHQFFGRHAARVVIALALAPSRSSSLPTSRPRARCFDSGANYLAAEEVVPRPWHRGDADHTRHGRDRRNRDRVAVDVRRPYAEIGPVSDVIHRPQHPYTVGLMGSIPTFGHETERLTQIDGSMPRLTAIPSGCAFHPRCVHAFDRCPRERPDLLPAGTSMAACWLHDVTRGKVAA